MKKNFLKFNTI